MAEFLNIAAIIALSLLGLLAMKVFAWFLARDMMQPLENLARRNKPD